MMKIHGRRPIVVGVSDTPSGWAAIRAAAALARQDRAPVELVRVWRDVDWFLSAGAAQRQNLVLDKHREQRIFATACAYARALAPEVEVCGEFVPGSIYGVLLERTDSARRLVLGTSNAEGGPGDVGAWYLEHARCPVSVIEPDDTVAATSEGRPIARMATYG
jgi:hypothetical protein